MALPLLALLPVVAQLAPGLMRYLAGDRAGDVTRQVATAVQAAAGVAADDAEGLAAALADPARAADLRLELARIEAEQAAAERAAETERMRLVLADVAGARAHNVALAQAGSRLAWMPVYKSIALDAVFVLLLLAVVSGWSGLVEMPQSLRDILTLLVGVIVREWSSSNGYWLGTSRGAVEMHQALTGQGGPFGGYGR